MKPSLLRPFALSKFTLALLFTTLMNAGGEARVFLLAGQSNMSGAGLFNQLTKSDQKPPEGVKIWNQGAWHNLGPGFSANTGRFGPELAFGKAMKKAYPSDSIYLIKTAAGGTSMHKHWNIETGTLLKRFLKTAEVALQDLKKKRVNYQIAGMLWMQGESDAAQGKGAEYEDSLKDFIKAMRKEFKEKDMPFLMGRILPTFDQPTGNGPLVRDAQEKLARELKNVACFDTDDFPRINKGHYNHEGQLELGNTYAKIFLNMMAEVH